MWFAPVKTGYPFCPLPNYHTSQVAVKSSCPECPIPPYLCIVFCIAEHVPVLNIHVLFSLNADQEPTNQSINHISKNVRLSFVKHCHGDTFICQAISRRNDMIHLSIKNIIAIIMWYLYFSSNDDMTTKNNKSIDMAIWTWHTFREEIVWW